MKSILMALGLCAVSHGQCANGQCQFPAMRGPVFQRFAQPMFRPMPRQISQAPYSQPSIQYITPQVRYYQQPVVRFYGSPRCVGGVCR